jgi:integrase
MMNLTERRIAQLAVENGARDRLIFDDEQKGLAVRVTVGGSRSYLAQYTLHGVKHRVPLGSCGAVSLAKARRAAAAIMGDVARGKNPAAERKEETAKAKRARQRLTLGGLIDTWEELYLSGKRTRYAAEATRALRHAFAKHLEHPAEDLDRATIVRTLDGKLKSEAPSMASRTAAYGHAAFAWSVKRGTITSNPFAELPSMGSPAKRARVLSDEELAAVWRATDEAAYGLIVRMLILTGQRREEVAGMTWGELSDDLTAWTIPAERTKNRADHIVPLAEPAKNIILSLLPEDETKRKREAHRAQDGLVFPGRLGTPYGGWSKSKSELDKASGVTGWRIHDLRRTLATGLQKLGVRLEVTEAVLNHVSGSRGGIVGIYQRHDWANEKRAASEAWAEHLLATVELRRTADNVTPLRMRA